MHHAMAAMLLTVVLIAGVGCGQHGGSQQQASDHVVPIGGTEDETMAEARAPFANDLGPATIDISAYPPQTQAGYKTFSQKCSKCHTLARPINSQYASSEMWERYVKRMWRKPGSNITFAEAKQIWTFLAYDGHVRKVAHREAFEAHRRQLLEQFKRDHPDRYQELYADHEADAVRLQ